MAVNGTRIAVASIVDTLVNVFLSSDNGNTWQCINTGLVGYVQSLTWINDDLFAGTTDGVFRLMSGDSTWSGVNDGLTNYSVKALTGHGDYLFLIGDGSTIWRRPILEITGIVSDGTHHIPKKFSMNQNYPNPFNPSTTISYQLPKQSHVSLNIFDILGRQVMTLVNEVEQPGYKSIKFDASILPTGVYFYRLTSDSYVETKKLLLVR
jgi:hypothetical protein